MISPILAIPLLTKITFNNFEELEVAWEWDGASLGAVSGRSTPSYVNGILYTVAGSRRHVVAIDPKTGETLWSYRLPNTGRWEYSMRADYGKGIGYSEVNGRGVVYMVYTGILPDRSRCRNWCATGRIRTTSPPLKVSLKQVLLICWLTSAIPMTLTKEFHWRPVISLHLLLQL